MIPKGVEVDAVVEIATAADDLARGTCTRAIRGCPRDLGAGAVARHERDAEVGHLGDVVLPADQDVGRLEIAVDHPLVVGRADAGRDLAEDGERLLHGEGIALAHVRGDEAIEALPVDVLHHQVEVRPLHGDGAQVDDGGVVDLGERAALGQGAGADVLAVGQLAAHGLDDHVEAGVDVAGEVDDAHAPFAENTQDGVFLVDQGARGEVLRGDERFGPRSSGGRRGLEGCRKRLAGDRPLGPSSAGRGAGGGGASGGGCAVGGDGASAGAARGPPRRRSELRARRAPALS